MWDRRATLGVSMALSLAVGCATPTSLFATRVEVQPVEASSLFPVGRLRVAIPPGFSPSGSETWTTGVEVWTERLEGTADERWARELAALPVGAERERFDWGDDVRAVSWAQANDLYLQVMKPFGDHVLWLRRDYPAQKLATAEKLLRELLRVYSPGSRDGFGVEHGAFHRVAQLENAQLSLRSTSPDVRLRLISRSTVEAEQRDPALIAREVEAAGGRLELLRAGPRTVAGLSGQELVMKLTAPDLKSMVRFEWAHRGAPSSRDPGVALEATGLADSAAAVELAWEQLVRALQVELPR